MAKDRGLNLVKSQVIYKDYSKDAERTALVSGENLSHMFGKIARWYTDISWVGHTHTEANITDFGTYAGASTKGGAATSANKLNIGSADIGSETKPVYFSYLTGKPVACTYSLNASVPANAVFTDINVKQSPSTADESREVLFAGNTGNTETTGTVGKSNKLYFNPSTGALTATSFSGSIAASNLTGTIDAGRLPTTAVTAGSYGPAAGGTLTYGGTFDVPYVTVDKYGRLTAGSTKTFTMPAQYTHPTYTSKTSGLYKITVDGTGHVSATAAVTASDLPSHSHTLSMATSTGSSSITLAANTKYQLTAGGSTYIFTTPTDTVYTHPTYTEKTNGLYKITVDSLGHVSATATVTASDLPAHTHDYAGSNTPGGSANRALQSNNCWVDVTNPSTNTKYGIVFVTDPNVSEDNTLRKTDAFRVNHFLGAAGTEGITEIVLGNNVASSAANNSSGHISVYNSNGKFTELKPGTNSTDIRISLPSAEGTLALVGDNNHTHNYVPNTKAGIIAGINLLESADGTPVDGTYYISQHNVSDGSNTNYYRRTHLAMWNYIKGKADSVYAPKSHSHSYLPLSGGTMTGAIILPKDKYGSDECGLDCNNSNIINANNIKFGDTPDTDGSEGIHYYRSATTWDSLWGKDGVLYFTPNFPSGTTHYTIYHSGNLTYSTIDAASSSHTHGLLDTNLQVSAPNSTTDTWASINAHGTGFVLRSIRTQANAAPYMIGNYSAGIVFGGADTRGVITHAYDTPSVKFAGGNRTAADGGTARWYFTLNATTGQSYTLPSTGGTLTDIIYKASNYYATSGHTHNYVPNTQDGVNAAINLLSEGNDAPVDADYYIAQYAGGGTTYTSYYRRPVSKLWDYIKGKADSVYAAKSHSHSYLPLSGGTMTGDLSFASVTSTEYPAVSKQIAFGGSTDGGQIFFEVAGSDKGCLVIQTTDDPDAKIVFRNKVTSGGTRANEVTITDGVLAGNGSGLTNLNASNISSGTIAAARLPAAYLPLTGDTMSGLIKGGRGYTHLALGTDSYTNDYAGLDKFNNVDINTWYGFSVSNACTTVGTLNQVVFSVNARTGNVYARTGIYVGSTKVSLEGHTHNYVPNTKTGVSAAITLLDVGDDTPVDNCYYITQTNDASSNTYFRRKHSVLWTYIKGKADSVYAAASHTHSYLPLSGGTLTGYLKLGASDTETLPNCGITVHDIRSVNVPASGFGSGKLVNFYFHCTDTPNSEWWSIMHMKGWTGAYCAWELAGTAHNGDGRSRPLYVRTSNENTAWGSWRKIYDSSNKPTLSELGAASSSHTHNYAGSSTAGGDATRAVNSNNCATVVTNASSGTNYGIVFVADPGASEDNTLRKTYDFRLYHWRGAANTEGVTELILGNSTPKTSDKNSSGAVYLYNGIGYWTAINSALGTANITISLPPTGGNMTNVVYKTGKTLSAVSHSGWTNATTDNAIVPTMSFIAYWNGAYDSSGTSNLAYCNKGAFGTIITKGTGDYVANTSDGMSAGINKLTTGESTPADADYYVAQWVNGGTTTTTYVRRTHSALWSYIKDKADSVYLALSGGTLTGNLSLTETKSILLRPNHSSYTAGIGYDTSGNECIGIWAKNTNTRLRWYAGTDMTTMTSGTMMNITPDFEISKASGSASGYIGGNAIIIATDTSVSQAINKLSTGTSTPSDNDYYVAQYANGGTATTSYHRRLHSALFSYINSKLYKILWSGSTSCTARSSTSITLTTAIAANKYRFIKVVWNCGSYTGSSEFRGDMLNATNNVPTGSDATTTNMVQFKIASDGKSVSVGPGTAAITVLQIAGVYPL